MVHLIFNYGYQWFKDENLFVKGYLYDKDGKAHQGKELLKYFEEVDSFEVFKSKLKEASGCFSVILKNKQQYFIAVDIVRTFPLFYSITNNGLVISDDVSYIKSKTYSNNFK